MGLQEDFINFATNAGTTVSKVAGPVSKAAKGIFGGPLGILFALLGLPSAIKSLSDLGREWTGTSPQDKLIELQKQSKKSDLLANAMLIADQGNRDRRSSIERTGRDVLGVIDRANTIGTLSDLRSIPGTGESLDQARALMLASAFAGRQQPAPEDGIHPLVAAGIL